MKKLILLLFIIPILANSQVVDLNTYDTITDCETALIDLDAVYSCYNDSAEIFFDRMTTIPPLKLKRVISTIYDTLQTYHIDDTLDFFYYNMVHTSQAATLDWIRDTTATLVNSPTFTAYEGFLTNGTDNYIKTNYNPGTDSVHYGVNSASAGQYIRTNDYTATKRFIGIYDGTNSLQIYIATINIGNIINSGSSKNYAHENDVSGFTILTRQNATTIAYARNSANYTTASKSSIGIPNQVLGIFVGAHNANGAPSYYSNNQFSCEFGGGQLTELQKTKLAYIINWGAIQYSKNVY